MNTKYRFKVPLIDGTTELIWGHRSEPDKNNNLIIVDNDDVMGQKQFNASAWSSVEIDMVSED